MRQRNFFVYQVEKVGLKNEEKAEEAALSNLAISKEPSFLLRQSRSFIILSFHPLFLPDEIEQTEAAQDADFAEMIITIVGNS